MEDAYREFAAAAAMHHEQTSSAVANKFSGQHILQRCTTIKASTT